MKNLNVFLIDDDLVWAKNFKENLTAFACADLAGPGYDQVVFRHARDQEEADQAVLERGPSGYDLVLLDLVYPLAAKCQPPDKDQLSFQGMRWLPDLRRLQPDAPIVILTAFPHENQLRDVVNAIRDGYANDFVPKTADTEDIVGRIRIACLNQSRARSLRLLEQEFHAMLRSRSASVLADAVGRLIDQSIAELMDVAQRIESGDPSSISNSPAAIRGLSSFLRERYAHMTASFADIGQEQLRDVDLRKTVGEMLTLYARKFGDVGAEVLAPPEEHGLRLTTYESDVRIALHEVLCNAADALKESRIPVPERRVELKIATDGGRAIISITDNGGGFSDEALAHMFEPHFSTRKDGRHQGIGLYVAKHMVQAVGGSIDARNSSKGGAEVLLTIPDLSKR